MLDSLTDFVTNGRKFHYIPGFLFRSPEKKLKQKLGKNSRKSKKTQGKLRKTQGKLRKSLGKGQFFLKILRTSQNCPCSAQYYYGTLMGNCYTKPALLLVNRKVRAQESETWFGLFSLFRAHTFWLTATPNIQD